MFLNLQKELNLRQKQYILFGVFKGLAYLHEQGVPHGNVKLSNIVLDKNFVPKICDFGI